MTAIARVRSIAGMALLVLHASVLLYLAHSQWGRRGVIAVGAILVCLLAGGWIAGEHLLERDRAASRAWESCFHACSQHASEEAMRRYPPTDAGMNYLSLAAVDSFVDDCAVECRERER